MITTGDLGEETAPEGAAGAGPSARARPSAPAAQRRNPLHGVTLERMLTELVAEIGWEKMGQRVKVKCFTHEPNIASSLKLLRKTPWAREKVEAMYLYLLRERARRERGQNPP